MSVFNFNGSFATFDYAGTGNKTKTHYMGTFKVKCLLSPLDKIKIDRTYRELVGSTNPHMASKTATDYIFALSQLKYRVIESPDFFKNKEFDGGHLDGNVLAEIINLCIDAEAEYEEMQNEKVEMLNNRLAESVKKGKLVKKEEFEDPIDSDEVEIEEDEE